MKHKIIIIFFSLLSSISLFAQQKKVLQKENNKEKVTKTPIIKEEKELQKVISSTKIDTSKLKIKNIVQEIDSTSILLADFKFKLLKKKAHASYYHQKFQGKRTASGKKFDNNSYTAAHKKLPFGTKVKVTNEVNGKFVIVEITDRGPFSKAREIDLTKRAFMEIANNKNSGVVFVTLEVVEEK